MHRIARCMVDVVQVVRQPAPIGQPGGLQGFAHRLRGKLPCIKDRIDRLDPRADAVNVSRG